MTTDERDVFVQIRNSIVSSKALVLVNFLSTFVHDHDLLVTYIMEDAVNELNCFMQMVFRTNYANGFPHELCKYINPGRK